MDRYAIVRDGVVENVSDWDGVTDWSPPEGTIAVLDKDGVMHIGGNWNGSVFTPAPPIDVPQTQSIEQMIETAKTFEEFKKLMLGKTE